MVLLILAFRIISGIWAIHLFKQPPDKRGSDNWGCAIQSSVEGYITCSQYPSNVMVEITTVYKACFSRRFKFCEWQQNCLFMELFFVKSLSSMSYAHGLGTLNLHFLFLWMVMGFVKFMKFKSLKNMPLYMVHLQSISVYILIFSPIKKSPY